MRYLMIADPDDMPGLDNALTAPGTLLSWQTEPGALRAFLSLGHYDLILLYDPRLPNIPLSRLACNPCHAPVALCAPDPDPVAIAEWLSEGVNMVLESRASHDETAARLSALARRAHGAT